MRAKNPYRRVCTCGAYHFPHRFGSGACGAGGTFGLPGYGVVDPNATVAVQPPRDFCEPDDVVPF